MQSNIWQISGLLFCPTERLWRRWRKKSRYHYLVKVCYCWNWFEKLPFNGNKHSSKFFGGYLARFILAQKVTFLSLKSLSFSFDDSEGFVQRWRWSSWRENRGGSLPSMQLNHAGGTRKLLYLHSYCSTNCVNLQTLILLLLVLALLSYFQLAYLHTCIIFEPA